MTRPPIASQWRDEVTPKMEDAAIELTEAQTSALAMYWQADEEGKRLIKHQIEAWDRALGRGDTFSAKQRKDAALRFWGPHIFTDGLGI